MPKICFGFGVPMCLNNVRFSALCRPGIPMCVNNVRFSALYRPGIESQPT